MFLEKKEILMHISNNSRNRNVIVISNSFKIFLDFKSLQTFSKAALDFLKYF